MALVQRLEGNWFANNLGDADDAAAIALYLEEGELPRVRARRNRLTSNDIAVTIRGNGPIPRDAELDFGRPGDPGDNRFLCSGFRRGRRTGGHVVVEIPAEPGAILHLAGNQWGTLPLLIHRGPGRHRPVDVALDAQPGPIVDLGGAVSMNRSCVSE